MPTILKTVSLFQCNRCGHEWLPVKELKPRVCPKCKSPYWDAARVRRTASYWMSVPVAQLVSEARDQDVELEVGTAGGPPLMKRFAGHAPHGNLISALSSREAEVASFLRAEQAVEKAWDRGV